MLVGLRQERRAGPSAVELVPLGGTMHSQERRSATANALASGRLPVPWRVAVRPGDDVNGRCDGCGDDISDGDYVFAVELMDRRRLRFHDECFDVYNRNSRGRT